MVDFHSFTSEDSKVPTSPLSLPRGMSVPLPTGPKLLSPALSNFARRAKTYELKFVCSAEQAAAVLKQLRHRLTPDPHGSRDNDYAYHVSSIYCDNAEQSVFHGIGRFGSFKLRARRYDYGETVFLERKTKCKQQVRKKRTPIPLASLPLCEAVDKRHAEAESWFVRGLARNGLRPTCVLEYERAAYFADDSSAHLRITFDRQIRGASRTGWSFAAAPLWRSVLAGQVICEFKFISALPGFLKDVIADQRLFASGVSKYREFVNTAREARLEK